MAEYRLKLENQTIFATISGTFTIELVERYERDLLALASQCSGFTWGLIADVSMLQVSPFEAVNRANQITAKLLNQGCHFIINIAQQSAPIVEHQLKVASGVHSIHTVTTLEEAISLRDTLLN